MKRGLLLFAHGARDPRWAAPFEAVARRVREIDASIDAEVGFLDFMTPDLRGAGEALVRRGCDHVDVVPLFLGAGGHVRKDIPLLVAALEAAHPQVRWALRATIGEHPAVIEAMARSAME